MTDTAERRIVTFSLGARMFGIDMSTLVEIREWERPAPLPKVAPYIMGVANLRGTVIPIIDLSDRLGWGDTAIHGRSCILVVVVAGKQAGFLVDEVADIISIDGSQGPARAGDGDLRTGRGRRPHPGPRPGRRSRRADDLPARPRKAGHHPAAGPGGVSIALARESELGAAEYKAIAGIMHDAARITLGDDKGTMVQSRLSRRLRQRGIGSFRDYLRLVQEDPDEQSTMVAALTTNHTHFFRESHHFDHFRSEVLPTLKARAGHRPVRLWSAGCSSGEEVYSLAMCLLGDSRGGARWALDGDVRLLATDISAPVVAATARGFYPDAATGAVPPAHRELWMEEVEGGLRMTADVRRLVGARELNLFGEWPMKHRFDVIFCRNVMIYFDDRAKAELEQRLVDQLHPGGTLYIGHSERLVGEARAAVRPCGHNIYRKAGELP
jgi:chemotaxis protein methyltransferase CheR